MKNQTNKHHNCTKYWFFLKFSFYLLEIGYVLVLGCYTVAVNNKFIFILLLCDHWLISWWRQQFKFLFICYITSKCYSSVDSTNGAMDRAINPSWWTHWTISHSNQCSTTSVTKAVVCVILSGMMHRKEPLLLIGKSSPCCYSGFPLSLSNWCFNPMPYNCK